MLRLTDLLGRRVTAADGTPVGRIVDVAVHLEPPGDGPHPEVTLLGIGSGRRIERLVRWDVVGTADEGPVRLRTDAADAVSAVSRPLGDGEVLLGRDVLDTQIFDIDGQRLARVGEVYLASVGDGRLRVEAVDVGMGAVWARVGLGPLARRASDQLVDWRSLHLTSAGGHPVQLAAPRSAVHHLDPAALAGLISGVSTEVGAAVLGSVAPEHAADAVASVGEHLGDRLLRAMPDAAAERVLEHLDVDRATRARAQRTRTVPASRRFLRHRQWRRRQVAR